MFTGESTNILITNDLNAIFTYCTLRGVTGISADRAAKDVRATAMTSDFFSMQKNPSKC